MTYIRKKNIKGHTYYYEVSSHRVDGKVVQRHERYMGKHAPEGHAAASDEKGEDA